MGRGEVLLAPFLVRSSRIWSEPSPVGGRFSGEALGWGRIPRVAMAGFGTFCVDTQAPIFAITYDDGPDPEHTPRILDELAERGHTATFFVLGERVAHAPAIVRRIVDDGHELALHGMSHRALTTMSNRAALAEVRAAKELVEDLAGTPVRAFRPPYGKHTLGQALGLRRLGLELVIWSGHAWDWLDAAPQAVATRAVANVFPGAILLLHDRRADPETLAPGEVLPRFDRAAVLGMVLDVVDGRGLGTVSATELVTRHRQVRSVIRDRITRE